MAVAVAGRGGARTAGKKGKRTTSRAKGNLTNKTEVNLLRKPKSMAQPHPGVGVSGCRLPVATRSERVSENATLPRIAVARLIGQLFAAQRRLRWPNICSDNTGQPKNDEESGRNEAPAPAQTQAQAQLVAGQVQLALKTAYYVNNCKYRRGFRELARQDYFA